MLFLKLAPRKDKKYKAPHQKQFQKLSKAVIHAVQKLFQSEKHLWRRIKQTLWHKSQPAKYYTDVIFSLEV